MTSLGDVIRIEKQRNIGKTTKKRSNKNNLVPRAYCLIVAWGQGKALGTRLTKTTEQTVITGLI